MCGQDLAVEVRVRMAQGKDVSKAPGNHNCRDFMQKELLNTGTVWVWGL